ncbi:WhiB family transcriptional regulator [Streptomyces sp. NPDC005500]|uniref:WhiB family transcriptional regulator n=1 Tax=Streptomyces sp. NPDC005500 TaxID=3155007 RepID=UPI0033AA4791
MSNNYLDPISRRRLPNYLTGLPSLSDWHQEAACAGFDTELFFPVKRGQAEAAVAICRRCPVVRRCHEHAMQLPESFGVWGGTAARERGWTHAGKRRKFEDGAEAS